MESWQAIALTNAITDIAETNHRIAKALETIALSYEPLDGEVLEATVFPFPVNED